MNYAFIYSLKNPRLVKPGFETIALILYKCFGTRRVCMYVYICVYTHTHICANHFLGTSRRIAAIIGHASSLVGPAATLTKHASSCAYTV